MIQPPTPSLIQRVERLIGREFAVWLSLATRAFGRRFDVTLAPSAVGAGAVSRQNFTVQGIRASDVVTVNPTSDVAGLLVIGARATGRNTIEITYHNTSAGTATPPPGYRIVAQ